MTEDEEKIEEKIEVEEDFEEKYFRLLAEMENSRKRLQKEKHDMNRFAVENIISEFLTPLDTFENALGFVDQMSEETRNWAKGFEMILGQFKEVLSGHNIHPFHTKGEFFDPYKHEAVETEETTEHPDGTILEEFLKGYMCGDRVLRAAKVKVAKAPVEEESNQQETNNDEEEK